MSSRTVIRRIAGDWATGGSTSGSIGGGGGVTTNVEVRGRPLMTSDFRVGRGVQSFV